MKNEKENISLTTASQVVLDLSNSLNLLVVVPEETKAKINVEGIITALNDYTKFLLKNVKTNEDQTKLDFEKEKVDSKENKATKENAPKNKDDKKGHLTIVKDKKEDVKEPAKVTTPVEPKVTDKTVTTLTAGEAYLQVAEAGIKTAENNKDKDIEKIIKKNTTDTYAKVHPESKLKEAGKDLDAFYLNILLPHIKSTIKAKAVKLAETKVEDSEKETPSKTDQVADILKATENDTPIVKAGETKKETETSSETDEANTLEDPKEAATALVNEKEFNAVASVCKSIYETQFKNSKDTKVLVGKQEYTYTDYVYNMLTEVKKLTGGFEKTHLIKLGNKPLLKVIKAWPSTDNDFKVLSA